MAPEERLERRLRLAEAMGWRISKEVQSSRSWPWGVYSPSDDIGEIFYDSEETAKRNGYPDFDNDPAALLSLMEWILKKCGPTQLKTILGHACLKLSHLEETELAEAILVTVDEVIRGEKEKSSTGT